jgi:polyisoprenoid-binding protein YceI
MTSIGLVFLRIAVAAMTTAAAALPASAQTWTLDPAHTRASFSARHMMVTTVRGDFSNVTGTVEYDGKQLAAAQVTASIDTRTLDTKLAQRDEQLKGPDFLDVAKFPAMTFKSTRIEPLPGGAFRMTGGLTIRGVTREVSFDAEGLSPPVTDRGTLIIGTTATAKISRKDFGMTWNRAVEAGGVLVGDEVTITLDVQMRRPAR